MEEEEIRNCYGQQINLPVFKQTNKLSVAQSQGLTNVSSEMFFTEIYTARVVLVASGKDDISMMCFGVVGVFFWWVYSYYDVSEFQSD